MKTYISIFLAFFCFACNNKDYINIEGTRILIVPIEGFKTTENVVGLKKDDNTLIEAYDILESYDKYSKANFSREGLEAKGASILDYKEIKVNGYPARYAQIQIDDTHKAHVVAFGDSTFCASLMGSYSSSDEETGKQIINTFLNAKYDKNIKVQNIVPKVFFTLNDEKSVFKIAKHETNVYVYALNGISKISYNPEPYVVASQIAYDGQTSGEKISDLIIQNLQTQGLTDINVKKKERGTMNGYEVYETEILGNLNGQELGHYCLVVINGDKAITIEGFSFSEFEKNLEEFKKLAYTIEFIK